MPMAIHPVARATMLALGLMGGMALHNPASAIMVTPAHNPNGEPFLYDIMNSTYGAGNYTQLDSTNGAVGTNVGQSYFVNYQVRYAADPGTYGLLTDNGTFHSLMSFTGGTGPLSAGAVATPPTALLSNAALSSWVPFGSTFTTGFRDTATGATFSSDPSKNADGLVHLIMFELTNRSTPNSLTFVGAWKDALGLGDGDYNDLILEWTVTFASDPTPVPEPATLALLGASCLLLAGARLKSKSAST
jgi:hypothetical protein